MRFAFIVNNYPPRVGGVESHVHSLVAHLIAQGHEALIVTLLDAPGDERVDGYEVVRLREHLRVADVLGFPSPGTTSRIARMLRERRIDVVSVHTRFFPMSWVGVRAARRAGVPVIHTEHGSDHVVSSSRLIQGASRLVDRTIGRWVLRNADLVIGVSERVVEFVYRLSGREARVFYNAIEAHSAPRVTRSGAHAVFVGRLVPGKGADVFVDAIALLGARGIDVQAEVLGDGVVLHDLRARVESHGLGERIALRGRVSAADVRSALGGAILINPTTLAEGFQMTLLEALDGGGAIVTYDVPGAAVLRDQGQPVVIVRERTAAAIADAVEKLLRDGWRTPPLLGWSWTERAAEYAALARGVVGREDTGPHR